MQDSGLPLPMLHGRCAALSSSGSSLCSWCCTIPSTAMDSSFHHQPLCISLSQLFAETTAMDVTATLSPALPASSTPVESSTLLPTTDSTTTATLLSSSPETEASTSEESSTFPETGNTSLPTELPPTTTTEDSVESSAALADTTASPVISTSDPVSTPSSSYSDRTTPGIFPSTMDSIPGTLTISGTPVQPWVGSARGHLEGREVARVTNPHRDPMYLGGFT